jgi:hypothetical protein
MQMAGCIVIGFISYLQSNDLNPKFPNPVRQKNWSSNCLIITFKAYFANNNNMNPRKAIINLSEKNYSDSKNESLKQ